MDSGKIVWLHSKGGDISIACASGIVGPAIWNGESMYCTPFLMYNNTPLVAESITNQYLFTVEYMPRGARSTQELTLIARGILVIKSTKHNPQPIPWEFQVTYFYDDQAQRFTVWLRPVIRTNRVTQLVFGLHTTWGNRFNNSDVSWATTPTGLVIAAPQQTGVEAVVTSSSFTLLANQEAPAATLLVCGGINSNTAIPVAQSYANIQLNYPKMVGSCIDNGIPVASTWQEAEALLEVVTPAAEWQVQTQMTPCPAWAPSNEEHGDTPGRYWYEWVLQPCMDNLVPTLKVILPFRYWPKALAKPAQAAFAQLLLSANLGDHFLVAYNFVHPKAFYSAYDRDDVLAEQAFLCYRLYQLLGDPDLCYLAFAMVEKLLTHQHEDGGFTFGMSVNGCRADYSDSDADAITCLLALAASEEATAAQRQHWWAAALRAANYMLTFQDPEGFFWGRVERPDKHRYSHQPWFTSYSAIACLAVYHLLGSPPHDLPDVLTIANTLKLGPGTVYNQPSGFGEVLLKAAERALNWLCAEQGPNGCFRYDTSGFYADYDDLSNTAVSVWALCSACRALPAHPRREVWWHAACTGVRYLLTLETPLQSGQYAGQGIPGVMKLVYDYKLGPAWEEFLAVAADDESDQLCDIQLVSAVKSALERYTNRIRQIQGKGNISGGWASLYSLNSEQYLAEFNWHERGSTWQEYVFLGWQGKLVLLGGL